MKNLIVRLIQNKHRILTISLLLFLLSASYVYGQSLNFENSLRQMVSGGQNKPKFDIQTVTDMATSGVVAIGGCPKKLDGTQPDQLEKDCENQIGESALETTGKFIAALYIPPVSGVYYLADVGNNLKIVKPAYAQTTGTGFTVLQPVLKVWKVFRNFSYVFFVLIFVASGFAIMFRMKLSPQTVISIQSALPRIVIALLLATFSYAIAGFLIDLMYVLMYLVITVLAGVSGQDLGRLREVFITSGFTNALRYIFDIVGWGAAPIPVFGLLVGFLVGTIPAISVLLPTALVTAGTGAAIGLIIGILIVLAIILYLSIKLFIELLKAYISILLLTIFAPLQIAAGVIPGFPGFGSWFRNLLGNILVFPAVATLMILARTFQVTIAGIPWTPPMLAGGSNTGNLVHILIAWGMLFFVVQVPAVVKKAVGATGFEFDLGRQLGWGKAVYFGTTGALGTAIEERQNQPLPQFELAKGLGILRTAPRKWPGGKTVESGKS